MGTNLLHEDVLGDVPPVLRQDITAKLIFLNLPDYIKASAFQAQVEPTDTGEEAPDFHP